MSIDVTELLMTCRGQIYRSLQLAATNINANNPHPIKCLQARFRVEHGNLVRIEGKQLSRFLFIELTEKKVILSLVLLE